MAMQWQWLCNDNGYTMTTSNKQPNKWLYNDNGYAMIMAIQWQWLYNDNFQQTA
jgi:hypothetical protein